MPRSFWPLLLGSVFIVTGVGSRPLRADAPTPDVNKSAPSEETQSDTKNKANDSKPPTDGGSVDGSSDTKHMTPFQKEAQKMSPSFQQKKWTGKQASYETNVEYDYVAPAGQNLGNGHDGNVSEQYVDVRHEFMRHTLLAFLVQGGLEYEHMGFRQPDDAPLPGRLDMLVADIGIDFRWSEKDLVHIEGRPGLYTDFEDVQWKAVNSPIDVGYTRVVSNKFQWVVGFSYNSWRQSRFLGAGGVRWQINDRWKIKGFLPTPDIEYAARPDLTLTMGADLRGDSYRLGPHFGNNVGRPYLNNGLLDYQEVRVGPGFSWNVKPFIELNFMTGYMMGRQYNFHNVGPTLNGSGSLFVSINVHALFKLPGETQAIPQRDRVSFQNIFNYL